MEQAADAGLLMDLSQSFNSDGVPRMELELESVCGVPAHSNLFNAGVTRVRKRD